MRLALFFFIKGFHFAGFREQEPVVYFPAPMIKFATLLSLGCP